MPKKPNKDGSLRRVYEGIDTVYSLPTNIYLYNASHLISGVNKGWGNITFGYNSPDYKLYERINDNVYLFSGAKTFQQTKLMSAEIVKDGKVRTYEEFKKSAGVIFDDFNEKYLRTEYSTALEGASGAKNWSKIQSEKHIFPYGRWITSEDATVCPICAPLNGMTMKVDSKIFKDTWTPLHYECHCHVLQVSKDDIEEGYETITGKRDLNKIEKHLTGLHEKNKVFKNNSGITGQVFTDSHPYFKIPKEYQRLAKNNFSLPIPENHVNYQGIKHIK